MDSVDIRYFDRLYAASDDPWGLASRWYETRKRAVIMACLPKWKLGRVFEPGCACGDLTAELAGRAAQVLATDVNARAVARARNRLAGHANVEIRCEAVPADWPAGRFDLIVLSELGYYFSPSAWADVAARCVNSLAPEGTILACHWLHDFDARRQSSRSVHAAIARQAGLYPQIDHVEKDFLLQLWSKADISVGEREGHA